MTAMEITNLRPKRRNGWGKETQEDGVSLESPLVRSS